MNIIMGDFVFFKYNLTSFNQFKALKIRSPLILTDLLGFLRLIIGGPIGFPRKSNSINVLP